jgi:Ca2+-transporting ATPase
VRNARSSAHGPPDGAEREWHALRSEEALAALHSDAATGLPPAEVERRLARFGPNALPEEQRRSIFAVFLHQFQSPLIYLLLVAAGIALALGHRSDSAVILVVVLLNAAIGAVQEGRAERSLEALRRLAASKARVLRAGREQVVEAREIVPGDVLLFAAGDAVAADARLLDGSALEVAEAALTGESLPIAKELVPLAPDTPLADRRNMVYAGTHVTAGRARAVVVGTGPATEIGRIAALAESAVEPKTPLERRIAQFGRYLVVAALAMVALVNAIGLLRGLSPTEMFMIAISQMVGMVPEGLPVAMTIALAVGVQRMARRGAIVRRLAAVETLGSTTVICSDKTGTLTRNEMTVTSVYLPSGRIFAVTGAGYGPEGRFLEDGREVPPESDLELRPLLEAAALCNDAHLVGPDHSDPRWRRGPDRGRPPDPGREERHGARAAARASAAARRAALRPGDQDDGDPARGPGRFARLRQGRAGGRPRALCARAPHRPGRAVRRARPRGGACRGGRHGGARVARARPRRHRGR